MSLSMEITFYDQPIDSDLKRYDEIRTLTKIKLNIILKLI